MLELYQGKREPADEVEKTFIERVQAGDATGSPHAKVWFKYLKVIGPRRACLAYWTLIVGSGVT